MKPNFLKENDSIYLVAPSFGCTTSPYDIRLKEAIKNVKELKYNIIEGPNIYKNEGVVASNTKEERAKEINEAFKSDASVIWSVGGGELMCEILPLIDFNIIKENPKWFVGFSDNTNLCYTITTMLDIETIYGANFPSLYSIEYDTLDTINMLKGKLDFKGYKKWQLDKGTLPLEKYHFGKRTIIKDFNYTTKVKGRIIGGCLDILTMLCGTKFDFTKDYIERHKDEGIIFFMEACDLNSISLRRALFQLKNSGWFDNVSMFLIGRSLQYYDKSFDQTMEKSYIDMLSEFNKPILFNIDLGHLSPSIPIRVGSLVTVIYNKDKKNIFFDYE